MWREHMDEKGQSQIRGVEAVRWTDANTVALKPIASISNKAWLRLFVAAQGVMIAAVLAWPRALWLPFLCDAVMASLTIVFAAVHLRSAKPEVRLIWIVVLCAMTLLSLGHVLQFWDLLRVDLQAANVSALGLGWGWLFVCARVPFLFLFSQIDEND